MSSYLFFGDSFEELIKLSILAILRTDNISFLFFPADVVTSCHLEFISSRSNDANVMTRTHWHFWISKTSASNTFDEIWKATDNSLFCFVSGFPASINVSFWYPFFSSSPCSLS